ncbi:MAG TPA: polysaccharide deacetylase family protein [Blastocatellia bacterium]|nr:polysaccharide deacetylase family protein [Blastocatellia bacterium]
MKPTFRTLAAVLGACGILLLTECQHTSEGGAASKCLEQLKSISELAGVLRSGQTGSSGKNGGRPLDGTQVAVTLNGMFLSHADPSADADDLCYKQNNPENLHKVIEALKANQIPPTVSFIIGKDFDQAMAEEWLKSGNLLGNMTYTYGRAARKTAQVYDLNIDRADQLLQPLWARYRPAQKYFRYPLLKVSGDPEAHKGIEAHLAEKGYTEVSATIDDQSNRFSTLYCAAQIQGDSACRALIESDYFVLLLDTMTRSRAVGKRVGGGREPKQILELYANQFTADKLDDILKWMARMGVKFIPLEDALTDPVYTAAAARETPNPAFIIDKVKREQRAIQAKEISPE